MPPPPSCLADVYCIETALLLSVDTGIISRTVQRNSRALHVEQLYGAPYILTCIAAAMHAIVARIVLNWCGPLTDTIPATIDAAEHGGAGPMS